LSSKKSSPRRRAEILNELGNEIRASQNRTELFDSAFCELLGINRTDNTALDVLERAGHMTAGELARDLRLTTGAVTALIDRLAAAGFVRRVPDANDRRRVLVELTPLTLELTGMIYGPIAQDYQQMAQRYSVQELELILDFTRTGNALDEKRRARLAEAEPEVRRRLKRSHRRSG
jgi:DNA-binding MarR family transcriptional regulator